ncbi:MAG TPA: peptide MFS transporter [Phycisphaerae bacterium]|nr:peptide MFS transporter [Phycisphaerae bacterium]
MSDTATSDFYPESGKRKGEIFGHPKGLYVLFFTELWERFSFYGMKTLLLLYMINHFFWSQERASDLLGTYAMLAYGLPVVGGFIADRYLGAKRAVLLGAALLSLGHLTMAFENMVCFYTALGLIIAGVGLLKPNVSTQVGALYKPGDPRRDGAFTIFYMGINLGALVGPLLCDWLRVHYGYSYGFAAAGVGMILGMIVYVIGQRKLVEFRQDVPDEAGEKGGGSAGVVAHPPHVVRDRIIVLLIVFAFIILFWTAFEQSPNAMLVWADKHTNLRLATTEVIPAALEETAAVAPDTAPAETSWWSDPSMTSGATQSFNPFFIIALAPIFAFVWLRLGRWGLEPSTPTKMVMGLALVAVAFAVMWPAATRENRRAAVPLAALPEGLKADQDGVVYSEEAGGGEPVYYGAKRLRYDAGAATLRMEGVLTDLDRLRLLGEGASGEFKQAVAELIERSAQRAAEAGMGETWSFDRVLAEAPAGFVLTGDEARKVAEWDPTTETLTVSGEIKDRAKAELLAAGAAPEFKRAIDQVYVESSKFKVTVWWLIAFYLVLTMGELCLSPVGLSLVTKLAPAKHVGLFMGGWFLATAIAEKLAQVFGAYWGKMAPGDYFVIFVIMCGVGALLMALLIRPLKRRMHGVN